MITVNDELIKFNKVYMYTAIFCNFGVFFSFLDKKRFMLVRNKSECQIYTEHDRF